MNDCRQQDAAVDLWTFNSGIADGTAIDTVSAGTYLKSPWKTIDVLGHSYQLNPTGTGQIQISTATKSSLAGVGIDWGIY